MNEKGFTMVELLVTILLLSIITTISVISITSFVNKNRENNYEILERSVIEGCKEYVIDNRYGVISTTITAEFLFDNHYITGDLIDPKTGQNIDKNSVVISISYQNNNYTCVANQEDWKLENGNYCCR